MRAVGATPRQVRRLAAAQATIVAVAALVPGIAIGYLLAERFRLLLASAGMLPSALPLTVSPLPAVAAALLLVIVVLVSAWCAAWRPSRMPATEAVTESRSEPRTPSKRRGFAGVLVLVGGATPGQIRSMMRREAALICAIALGTGVLLSVIPLALLAVGILHRPWPAGPLWLLPAVVVVVAGIAFLTIELPTRQALRTPPAHALTGG